MKTTVKPLIVSVQLLSSSLILAQDFNPASPEGDPGVSPINDYLIPMQLCTELGEELFVESVIRLIGYLLNL